MEYVCVFGASCSRIDRVYIDSAFEVGFMLAKAGLGMVFGGGDSGLMGAAARGIQAGGGKLIGVIPEKLNQPGIAFGDCDQLIVTPDMHVRKATMERLSGGYIALPGGFGTLEELLEVLTLNQLGYLCAPVIILNTNGYYDSLINQLDECAGQGFTDPRYLKIFAVADTPSQAVELVRTHKIPQLPNKMKEAIYDGP